MSVLLPFYNPLPKLTQRYYIPLRFEIHTVYYVLIQGEETQAHNQVKQASIPTNNDHSVPSHQKQQYIVVSRI
jgi:hypothetical protein